jgi:uncharacterized protein (DUF488 family)
MSTWQHSTVFAGRRKTSPQDVNGFWTNESFHNYADYALSAQFHAGLKLLLDEGRKRRCAIMCSEAVWWRCHRRIVTDYLIACGEAVFHIMGQGRLGVRSPYPRRCHSTWRDGRLSGRASIGRVNGN